MFITTARPRRIPVRLSTVLRRLIGVSGLVVLGARLEENLLVVEVKPRRRLPRCAQCGRRGPGYDHLPTRRWRHLGLGRVRVELEYAPRRVSCRHCEGVHVEEVAWASHASNFTYEFEELVAYLAQVTDKTKVTELMGISWSTVGSIVERVVERKLGVLLDEPGVQLGQIQRRIVRPELEPSVHGRSPAIREKGSVSTAIDGTLLDPTEVVADGALAHAQDPRDGAIRSSPSGQSLDRHDCFQVELGSHPPDPSEEESDRPAPRGRLVTLAVALAGS